jgi:hypothetical protein
MGWWEKKNEVYKDEKNSMNKIMEVFENKNGKVNKEKKGKIRIREVIDWNVSGRLLSSGE